MAMAVSGTRPGRRVVEERLGQCLVDGGDDRGVEAGSGRLAEADSGQSGPIGCERRTTRRRTSAEELSRAASCIVDGLVRDLSTEGAGKPNRLILRRW